MSSAYQVEDAEAIGGGEHAGDEGGLLGSVGRRVDHAVLAHLPQGLRDKAPFEGRVQGIRERSGGFVQAFGPSTQREKIMLQG